MRPPARAWPKSLQWRSESGLSLTCGTHRPHCQPRRYVPVKFPPQPYQLLYLNFETVLRRQRCKVRG